MHDLSLNGIAAGAYGAVVYRDPKTGASAPVHSSPATPQSIDQLRFEVQALRAVNEAQRKELARLTRLVRDLCPGRAQPSPDA